MSDLFLSMWLDLPDGYKALRFPGIVEIEGPDGFVAAIAVPYEPQPQTWWQEQAALKIKEAQTKQRR
jgi:hypothetical protein